MLSKSQAKAFFLFGTAVCSAAFIGLTIDTFQRIPAQTRTEKMSPEVIRGKHLFEKNNCMGCHTIFGEGAYYAPELTKAYERRGSVFIKSVLKDPEAMFPGQRKMVNYHFTEAQISDLTDFLKWIGEVDTNGFPPKPTTSLVAASVFGTGTSQAGNLGTQQPLVYTQVCAACHSLKGQGGNVGPALDGVGNRFDANYLEKWIRDPSSVKPESKMPKLPLSDTDIRDLVAYLSQLKGDQ